MAAPAANPIDAYARDVVAGRIVAGKYHRLACERHERDRQREASPSFPYRLDIVKAERFWRFAAKLRHYKGEWAGQRIVLQPYQLFRLGSIFGWVHKSTGLRRFRTAYNEIPRKQGKSLEAAVVALYVTFFDGEAGAEGYTIATKRDQAKIVWNDCKRLVMSSGLRNIITPLAANLHRERTAQKLEPLGADRDSTDGLNPSLIIVDEFHAQKNRGLIDVMETATGARSQPLNFQITTAGNNPMSPCGDQHDYACKILDRVIDDETFFAFIAHADPEDLEGDGWLNEDTWRKANPNYGVSVRPDDLRALATKARYMTEAANSFKQKRLNVWVNTSAPWLSPEGWSKGQAQPDGAPWCGDVWRIPDALLRRRCYLGIDLSSKIDLTAVAALFPPDESTTRWKLLVWALTPDDTLDERALRDRAPYRTWVERGYLRVNPGARIDQSVVRTLVQEAWARFDVQGIGIDPWNSGNLIEELKQDGLQAIEVAQNMAQMSGPSKEFEADVLDGLLDAGGNPLVSWCAMNVVAKRDDKDNIYPAKKRSRGRIDPIIAALIARRLAMIDRDAPVADDPDLAVA